MGTDINGWIAVRRNVFWYGIAKIGNIVERNYDMFSSLFGIQPYVKFTPIADGRGLPQDISEDASNDYLTWNDVLGETWISAIEIRSIPWHEEAFDERRKKMVARQFTLEYASGWSLLFRLVDLLVAEYGSRNVRLVVWFDQ